MSFNNGLTGGGFSLTVTGAAALGDTIGPDSITGVNVLLITGAAALDAAAVSTTGSQTYQGNATVAAGVNPALTTGGAAVTFQSDLALGDQTLTVNGNAAYTLTNTADLQIDLGGSSAFGSVAVTGSVALNGAALTLTRAAGFVAANGAQFILISNDGVDPVSGTFAGLPEGGTVVVDGVAFTISYQGGDGNDVVLTETTPSAVYVDDDWAAYTVGQAITSAQDANIPGLIFGYNAFATIQAGIDHAAANGLVEVFGGSYGGPVDVNKTLDRIRTATNQDFPAQTVVTIGGAVTLDANTTFAMEADGFGNVSADVTFGTAVTAAAGQTLTVNGGAGTTDAFDGTVNVGALTTDAGGATALNGGSVITIGAQSYGDAVTLGADSTLTSTGGGAITFGSTVDGAFALAVNTAGITTFGGAVGGTAALASLTTDAPGATDLNGGSVTTTGAQSYRDAATLGAAATLASTGGGAITFGSTVNGGFALAVNTAGITTFGGAVGGTTALASVTTDAPGSTALDGGSVTTSGGQSYGDAVTLGAAATLTSTGAGAIGFGSTVDGGFALAVNTAGTTTFGGRRRRDGRPGQRDHRRARRDGPQRRVRDHDRGAVLRRRRDAKRGRDADLDGRRQRHVRLDGGRRPSR